MAKRDGEGVGSVGRLGQVFQTELNADHLLHLALIGMTVAGHTRFDLAGRIAADGQTGLLGGEKHNAPDFGEAQGGANVESGKHGFDGHDLGLKFADQAAEQLVDVMEDGPLGRLLAFGGHLERAVVENAALAAEHFDDGVAGRAGSGGIDTENAQGRRRGASGCTRMHASKSKANGGWFQVVVSRE